MSILDYEIPPGRAAFDRVARDQVASALASYLRGEIDNLEFHRRLSALETADHTVREIRFQLYFMYDDFISHPVRASRQGWGYLRRTIAFLKSDLAFSGGADEDSRKTARSAAVEARGIAALSAMIAAGFIAWKVSLLGLLLPGLIEGPLILFCVWRDRGEQPREEQPDKAPFFPFACERDWLAHEHLVEAEGLPFYDPAVHDQPIRPKANRVWLGIRAIPAFGVFLFVVAPLLAVLKLLPHGRDERA